MTGQCPICLSRESAQVSDTDRHGKPLATLLCASCGHVYNWPVPSAEELAAFYADAYRVDYKGKVRPRMRQVIRNFDRVKTYFRTWWPVIEGRRRVLDMGAGSGEFVFFAQELGLEARGVEPNRSYSAYCREVLGIDVTSGGIEDVDFAPGSFDFIRLNHVLEHMADPVASLERLASWLAEDGVLYVEVPDIVGYAATKSRGNIFHYGHIHNFSAWTLRAAAGRAGLAELDTVQEARRDFAGTCFVRGRTWDVSETPNPANAERVRQAIAAHYAASAIAPVRRKRLADKVARRFAELRRLASCRTPQAAGRTTVAQFSAGA
ncbi:class I SAM-dependent methyltransferase [Futiania mangrovi]|uniref:Class I SAM-dependent methyltransferase n=1 Tax=Futiania mangrovi TaxID=2959716 RepID=A0A9J6PCI9_9PROT|nr:class I SAM-dependent methyltransferase [Futiania mangrovii]MCP1337948.1 class I SAM-dependent methyltransferase [Futiania mangrovii]